MATESNTSLEKRGGRSFRGTVVSAKMKDTIVVAVERFVMHPKYKKYLRRTKKLLANDVGNTKKEGEIVTIKEIRPMSKRKHFTVVN